MSLSLVEKAQAWAHAARTVSRDKRDHKHEPETPFMKAMLAPDDVCLHVGASDGRHSYIMAQSLTGGGRIFAFEPNPFSYAALLQVIRMHGLTNVEPFHAAVSDTPGEVILNVPVKASGRDGRSFGVIGETAKRSEVVSTATKRTKIAAVTMDGFLAEHGVRCDFIRMDIEGAEILALKGGLRTIEAQKPNLLLEIHPVSLKENFGSSAEEVTALFLDRGYRMFGLDDAGGLFETRECTRDAPWKDYFLIHPSRAARLPAGPFKDLMG